MNIRKGLGCASEGVVIMPKGVYVRSAGTLAKMKSRYSPPCSKEWLESRYLEGHTQLEIAKILGVSQKVVFGAMKRFGIKSRVAKKRNQWGSNNTGWKGGNASYSAFHFRVERIRGKPKTCEVCHTMTAKKYEWANLTRKYDDVNDYKRMCIPCHQRYDKKDGRNAKGQFVSNKGGVALS